MTAERKYTDRDIREDSTLRQIAENYIVDYGGDFEPLVNAVRMMEEGEELPTNVIRVVLNCMRHDYTVAGSLPNPSGPILEVVRNVPEKTKRRRKRAWDWPCDERVAMHDGHSWKGDDGYHWCEGIPFPLNREDAFWTNARSRKQFVLAKGGKLIHTASLEQGSGVYWRVPNRHEFGMASPKSLAIKTLCRYPSIITNPLLITVDEAMVIGWSTVPDLYKIKFCPHCIEEIEEECREREPEA